MPQPRGDPACLALFSSCGFLFCCSRLQSLCFYHFRDKLLFYLLLHGFAGSFCEGSAVASALPLQVCVALSSSCTSPSVRISSSAMARGTMVGRRLRRSHARSSRRRGRCCGSVVSSQGSPLARPQCPRRCAWGRHGRCYCYCLRLLRPLHRLNDLNDLKPPPPPPPHQSARSAGHLRACGGNGPGGMVTRARSGAHSCHQDPSSSHSARGGSAPRSATG